MWLTTATEPAGVKDSFKRRHQVIFALTVPEILDEHMAKKLA